VRRSPRDRAGRSARQRELRKRRGECAFLFTRDGDRCLGSVDRDEWEDAISLLGGDVGAAAAMCGLADVTKDARALWGRSAEEALATYRSWQRRKIR